MILIMSTRKPSAKRNAHLVRILPLPIVHVGAVRHVTSIDEELRAPHRFEEVSGSLELCHEFDEQLRSGVRVDAIHQAVDGADETVGRGGDTTVRLDRRVGSVDIWRDGVAAEGGTSRASLGGLVIRLAVRHDTHADEHDEEIEDDGEVGQPAELVQGPYLAGEEPHDGPDQAAHDVAQPELRNLRYRETVADDNNTDADGQLKGLEKN